MTRSRAEDFRRLAQDCLDTACTIPRPEARAILVQMAQLWLRLAEEQEESISPSVVELS